MAKIQMSESDNHKNQLPPSMTKNNGPTTVLYPSDTRCNNSSAKESVKKCEEVFTGKSTRMNVVFLGDLGTLSYH